MKRKNPKTANAYQRPDNSRKLMLVGVVAALGLVFWHFTHRPSEERFAAHQQEALDDMQAATKACADKHIYKEIKTYKEMAECATPGIRDAFSDAGFPYMDLIEAFTEERVKLGEQVDRREITSEEAKTKESAFLAKLQDEAKAREAGQK